MKNILFIFLFLGIIQHGFAQEDNSTKKYQNFDAALFPNGIQTIVVYSRSTCGRCSEFTNALKNNNIKFKEIPTDTEEIMQELDRKIYNALPDKTKGYATKFPVVELNGILFHEIANHGEFTKSLISFVRKE